MTTPNGGDPGRSSGPRYPTFMDPQNEFGRLTILQMTGKDGADLPVDPYLIGKSVESIVGENGIESAKSEQTKRKCPVFRKETDIIKLKVNNNLTYHEARRRIEEGNATYAQAAAQFRLDTPKLEALLEESKKKDDIIAKLITDNKKKDNTVNKLIEDLKQKAEQLDALTSKIDSLQSVLVTLSKDNQRVSRIPTDRTNSLKLSANTICNKEEKQLRRSKRLQQSSPDNKSPPSKTVKPASSDIELDSIIEYEEEEEECVFYTPDIENTSARNIQSIYPVHDSQPFK
ncbi:uncharacterized protein LOC134206578 [Armigeres subalbatus]|uniref:uncharacterized protein LOC134206578 n=1 Tax=Armigeres subalbatus TaxID=124917 RepID=UPI002ED4B764